MRFNKTSKRSELKFTHTQRLGWAVQNFHVILSATKRKFGELVRGWKREGKVLGSAFGSIVIPSKPYIADKLTGGSKLTRDVQHVK